MLLVDLSYYGSFCHSSILGAHYRAHGNVVLAETFEDGNCPSPGLFEAPYLEFLELSLISFVKPIEKYLAFEPRTGTKSQIYSQGKLTILRCEN
jgi:hypothetical protein